MLKIDKPYIITFANQKGGVGKTTLCACFANYLALKGVKVRIVDCDRQQSITRSRKRDSVKYGGVNIPYPVDGYKSLTRDMMRNVIAESINREDVEITLFDCPGSITEPWLIPLIANSDFVVIPFHYDDVTIASTSEFVIFVDRINSSTNRKPSTVVFMIPNISDKRVGTAAELRRWDNIREKYDGYGTVTPKIFRKADMERISTLVDLDKQSKVVEAAFNKIYFGIFGCTDSVRSPAEFFRSPSKNKQQKTEDNSDEDFDTEENIDSNQ